MALSKDEWVRVTLPESRTVDRYVFETRTDPSTSDRVRKAAPATWQVQGSTDGSTWDVLSSLNRQEWPVTSSRAEFEIGNPGEYQHYRFQVNEVAEAYQTTVTGEIFLLDADRRQQNIVAHDATSEGNAYIKISGECPDSPTRVMRGEAAGQMLFWDGTNTTWTKFPRC